MSQDPQSTSTDARPEPDGEVTLRELAAWARTACWFGLLMLPVLIWVNGPAVSTDQAWVRTALCVLIVTGSVGVWGIRQLKRLVAGRETRRESKPPNRRV